MAIISTDTFTLEELTYIPMGNHVPMLSRPYVVNASQQTVDALSQRMAEARSGRVTPSILSEYTNGIIQHSAVPYQTSLDSNWVSTRRFVFLLKVKYFDLIGNEINSYIQGYTDYDGISNTGNIDGNMLHHINNVIETTVYIIRTPTGIVRKEKLYKIYNVFSSQGDLDYFTQRPNDILENINTINMASVMSDSNNFEAYNVNNFINGFNNNVVGSNIDNGITSEYLSKILTTGVLANKSREIHIGSYEIGEQNTVESKVIEPSMSDNRFIKYLSVIGGSMVVRNQFNFNQLMSIDRTIFDRFVLFQITKDNSNPVILNTPEVGDYWHGQDPVTVKAYSLIEASVSIALKYGFNKLYFTASNMTNPMNTVDFFVTNFNSFINLEESDFGYILEILRTKFITDVFLPETNAGTIPIHMEGFIDIMGTSKINLSYAGFPSNWYTIPTVANSNYSSALTINHNAFNETSFNLGQVIDSIVSNNQTEKQFY